MANKQQCRDDAYDNGFDIIQLFHMLWLQRMLIISVVIFVTVVAAIYCFVSKPIYSSSTTLAPAPISLYGPIVGELKAGASDEANSPLTQGMALSNDVFRLYLANLASSEVRQIFDAKVGYSKVPVELHITKGREMKPFDEPAIIYVESSDAELARAYLDGVVRHAAETTDMQINSYLQSLGVNQAVTAKALFRVENASQPAREIKPRRQLILALSVVLGGMLGVFIALVRLTLGRCKQNA